MAVSGRKLSDFQGSVFKSSAEDFDHSCNPCLTTGQHIESHRYCVDCGEYLCKDCCSYHQRLKATRHHQLIDKSDMNTHAVGSKGLELCTERCSVHRNKIIKYFCIQHEKLACTDCISLNHGTCGLDYIPDKCAGISESTEYSETVLKLDEKVKEVEEIMKLATARDKEIDVCHNNLMKDAIKFRKEMNDRLDQQQKKIQTDADEKKSKDKQIIQKVMETCTTVSLDMKLFRSNLQDKKTSCQNGELYIAMKQAKSYFKLDEMKVAEDSLVETDKQYRFQKNPDLEKQDKLGYLELSTSLVTRRKKNTLETLTHKEHIDIRSKSDITDAYTCITGCAILSSKRLIIVDHNNKKLKVIDKQSKSVTKEKSFDSAPFDIAMLPKDQIAVTVPEEREILLLATGSKLSTVRKIPVKAECRCIDYHQDQLYVTCWGPNRVLILDTQGTVQRTISLDNEVFHSPNHIHFDQDSQLIYISNFSSNSIVSISLQGEIYAVYKHKDLRGPCGMVVLDDGSLLVCCCTNGTVHHISHDLKKGQTMTNGLTNPQSIDYNHHEHQVYIGSFTDHLKLYSLQ